MTDDERTILPAQNINSWPQLGLVLLLGLVVLLNYYDIMHTIELCSAFMATEGNPFMRYLLGLSPELAIVLKMGAAMLFALVMACYARINFRRALIYTSLITAVYLLAALWHVTGQWITGWLLQTN